MKGDFEARAPAADDPADVGPRDFVLFCVKTFDTAAAARLGPLPGESTAVVSLQNGPRTKTSSPGRSEKTT